MESLKKLPDIFYIAAKQTYTELEIKQNYYVLIDNGIIAEITEKPKKDIEIIQSRFSLLPGFLDLHIHGREGCDVMDGDIESIERISQSLVKHGVVGFLGATVTDTWDKTLKAFRTLGDAYHNQPQGAQVLGAYNEGLFFSQKQKGAHDAHYFQPLTKENINNIIEASNGSLKVVALAPELPNAISIIQFLHKNGIKVMLGHSNADYEQTCKALKNGACGGVHIFNAMKGIHHRDPGCAGAVLLDENAYAEVIADGIHLHPRILEMICRLKQTDKVGLISDCVVAGGLKDGSYKLGMLDINVKEGIARTNSGALAGSTLTLEKAVMNMVSKAKVSRLKAVNMASLSPAKFLGLDNQLGSIAIGKRACLTLVDDDFKVQATFIDGKLKYLLA